MLARQSAERHSDQLSAELSLEILEGLDVEPTRKSKPLSYQVPDVSWQRQRSTRGIEPDELLRLTYPRLPVGKNVAPFLVEIDRGKETIDPVKSILKDDFWRQSSILKKNIIYINDFLSQRRSGRLTCGHFGFKTFRPLYVTTTPAHMAEMQACEFKYFGDRDFPLYIRPGFILYTNWEAIERHENDVLAMPWEDRLGRLSYIDGVTR